ncbi:MAG TPA: iron uptake protein [Pseudoxanthomonas sp.]|nr:iron uptake protein [Pseudoxanthomonas sp.]
MSTITTTVAARSPRLQLAARIAAAVLGGYVFAWGFIAACASLMFAGGMDFHDAEFLGSLLGVMAFLIAFLWTFAARRLWVVWAVLVGGGALLAAVGSYVQSLLV